MKTKLCVSLDGPYDRVYICRDIDPINHEAFKPLRTGDEPFTRVFTGELSPDSLEARRVIQRRKGEEKALDREITEALWKIMERKETQNGSKQAQRQYNIHFFFANCFLKVNHDY